MKLQCLCASSLVNLAAAVALLSGCAASGRLDLVKNGPGADPDPTAMASFRSDQDKLLIELIAAVTPPTTAASAPATTRVTGGSVIEHTGGVTWDQVIRAGMDYADRRCEDYLHALYRLDRDRKTAVAQTGLLGAATAGVQAATGAAAKEVAIVAILFGLGGSTIDNVAGNLLYQLEPSSVRTLVNAQQLQYRANLGEGYLDRPAAMNVLRRYALLCVPANIESEVNLAVKKTKPEVKPGVPEMGVAPVVTNSTIAVSTTSFGADNNSALLDAFVNPSGKINPENERKLLEYMKANGVASDIRTTSFIFGKPFVAARKDAVKHFGLN
jgi:hypothetical protein